MNQPQETIQEYMNKYVKPIFDKLISQILKIRPDDIIGWSINWLQKQQSQINKQFQSYQREEEEGKNNKQTIKSDVAIQGEFNKNERFKPNFIEKTKDQIEKIKKKILNSFLFQVLDEQNLETVICATEEKKFQTGDIVIHQGDDGNELYVVDEGELECTKKFPNQHQETKLKTYLPGECFGELALLYNTPRAATIKAIKPVVAFTLDRKTFELFVKVKAIRKREEMEQILNTIELLKSLDSYEKLQFCDILEEKKYSKGEKVINQGEQGDTIYLIVEGELEAYKDEYQDKVYSYQSGDYFGELALLQNSPRQATIIAITDCTLYYCDFKSFTKLMGPLEQILRKNVGRYGHQVQ
ncbi:unnamed protein product (macronuclear) [Paramecium tetraurelia]|uniref:cAMP-dependent protein kinase regulatory subunit n=1 Tax=Paramecium tetraurelia TaxID=5888 RepID=A0DR32_PARTE|nr:uncharacterized protein GSPATT00002900001 [Paramecium tetraurelia]CAK85499.1 unnamed protein product [Paramecium tetraurelia]|eukprot:XP_001452896.1 hypothetical protein (macronuclear) [Paramecium tetraurelia strain d4-2]